MVILRADTISYMDASARAMLRALIDEWKPSGIRLCLAGAIGPVRDALASDGLIGNDQVCCHLNVQDAMMEWRSPGTVPSLNQAMAQQHRSHGA